MKDKIQKAYQYISDGKTIVMITGAGISTESGLPDFRGESGSRRDPERARKIMKPIYDKLKTIEYPPGIKKHSDYDLLFKHDALLLIQPNQGHYAIVELEKMGKLSLLVSQNMDNLHILSGFPPDKLIEYHGNCFILKCPKCNIHYNALKIRKKALKDIRYPAKCEKCGGNLRSSVVNFGEGIPEKEYRISKHMSQQADVFIAVGSSLTVTPAATLFDYAKENNAKTIIINLDNTPKDKFADVVIHEKFSVVLTSIVDMLNNS
jgi:NAD-dependent deacetylase